jgi:hypothetical protein
VLAHPHDFDPASSTLFDWSHPNPNSGEGFENTPKQLKVLPGLAQQFAVFDHWFCAVPSQTCCNRSFFHASTSSGYVTNSGKSLGLTDEAKWALNDSPTIFDRLDTVPGNAADWKVYYEAGTGDYKFGLTAFVHQRVHDYTTDTLLLVVFDEHGGTYDHVKPGTTSAPPVSLNKADSDYDFKTLGVRVPAIAISSFTLAGVVLNEPMHHAALIRTLCRKYGVAPLNDRDRAGGDLGIARNAPARALSAWPDFSKAQDICVTPQARRGEIPNGSPRGTCPDARRGLSRKLLARDDASIGQLPDDELREAGGLARHGSRIECARGGSPHHPIHPHVDQLGFHGGEVVLPGLPYRDHRIAGAAPWPASPAHSARHHGRRYVGSGIHVEQRHEQQALGPGVHDGVAKRLVRLPGVAEPQRMAGDGIDTRGAQPCDEGVLEHAARRGRVDAARDDDLFHRRAAEVRVVPGRPDCRVLATRGQYGKCGKCEHRAEFHHGSSSRSGDAGRRAVGLRQALRASWRPSFSR